MSNFIELWAFFEKIPATFWAVVFGSAISLGGVVLANRATDRRQLKQLDHDRLLKDRERELSLKKDVYLAAAEAISAGLISVTRFSNLDISWDKINEAYLEKAPAIARIHVVAREETAKAVAAFTAELGTIYVRLLAKRRLLVDQRQRLTSLREQITNYQQEQNRMLDLMKQYNLEGAEDTRRWEVMQRNHLFEEERIAKTQQELQQIAVPFQVAHLDYVQTCVKEHSHLTRLLVPIVVAVRRELDLPIDEVAYREIWEDGRRKQEAIMSEFIDSIKHPPAAQPDASGNASSSAPS